MRARRGGVFVARIAVHAASVMLYCSAISAECRLELGPVRSVARVIDGETLALDDGTEVRLIGALAPRAFDVGAETGQWSPERDATEALGSLVLGKTVTLGFAGGKTDKYGRWLAHVFVTGPDAEVDTDKIWVQGRQLLAGHARAYATAGHRGCLVELLAHERVARDRSLGLWREAAYAIRRANPPYALTTYRGTFQIVAGDVTRAGDARDGSYLAFGVERGEERTARDGRRDFSVTIKRTDREVLGQFNGKVAQLKGQRLEVRGWIENRAGPSIDISTAGLIAAADSAFLQRTPKLPRRRIVPDVRGLNVQGSGDQGLETKIAQPE
jgi:micrococcal nuclease